MNIEGIEQQLREAIKKRQDEGIAVRNIGAAIILSRVSGKHVYRGNYWNTRYPHDRYPNDALCLMGALGITLGGGERKGIADSFGITVRRLEVLEAGFENWQEYDMLDPLWALGRKLGKELEDQARTQPSA